MLDEAGSRASSESSLSTSAGSVAPIRIGLLWHSLSSGNLGVGALTLANMALARQVAYDMGLAPQFVVMGMRDGDAPRITGPDIEEYIINSRRMLNPTGFWRTVGTVDCVLDIGAGDSFADIYGAKRFGFLWLTKMMALARGKPLVLSPQTIGPFTQPGYRTLGAMAMRGASAIIARDDKSLEVAQAMAPSATIKLAVDVAFVLPFQSRRGPAGTGRLKIGVNASGLLFHEAETGRNRFGLSYDYAQFTRKLIARLIAAGAEVHLVPHATSKSDPKDDDGSLAERLASEFPQAVRVAEFSGASEAKSYISGLDFLVAGRMHACIGAYSANVPMVAVAYSRKFSGLFGMLEHEWMVPVTGMTDDGAVDYVLGAVEQREQIAAAERRGMTRVDGLLDIYRGELHRVFAEAMARRAD
ncbi:polysaccharide pyruvyl transferase family protein [Sphingobium limneticum]|uniref:polysaccharide pyruvyl transferase family protein n=1 Tax=Sphingobium limneticum TaxID=1007511 RepID=UPI00123D72F4|nr:polysaccharide pyruvyl transferase family protein [Sphingobium limneticum]KAA9013033.1 polysaccharide pyruvyl transferase family protein [Sphingobium limneticum]